MEMLGTVATLDYQEQQQQLAGLDANNISPEEVGKVINALQEEIRIIKLQLENLPGYGKGSLILFTL